MVEKNYSNGTADSDPDHFGIREIKDKSLWTVGVPRAIQSLNFWISAPESANSSCRRVVSVMIELSVRAV